MRLLVLFQLLLASTMTTASKYRVISQEKSHQGPAARDRLLASHVGSGPPPDGGGSGGRPDGPPPDDGSGERPDGPPPDDGSGGDPPSTPTDDSGPVSAPTPTNTGGRPDGGGGGGGGVTCPTTENLSASVSGPAAAPLRGSVGCVDQEAYGLRDLTTYPVTQDQDAYNIYGPMEAGFTSSNPGMSCLGDSTIPGGLDTLLAENIVHNICSDDTIAVLDACGGHAVPYHYHERMSCLYESDSTTGHSTRIGTAADGNGIYGMYIDGGVLPTDLDFCGGRFGVTPDSNGETVYYYPVKQYAPFTLGCYGPVTTVEECRSLFNCDSADIETVTTEYGSGQYSLDCPCFDENQSNVVGQGYPGYLDPSLEGISGVNPPSPTDAPVAAPTEAPVPSPTEAPVPSPTEAPVADPTEAPVPSPTEAPVAAPTEAPVPSPTEAPVADPTEAPVPSPTEAIVGDTTEAPVPTPTEAPVLDPTSTPVSDPTEAPVSGSPVPDPTSAPITPSPIESPVAPSGSDEPVMPMPSGQPVEMPSVMTNSPVGLVIPATQAPAGKGGGGGGQPQDDSGASLNSMDIAMVAMVTFWISFVQLVM